MTINYLIENTNTNIDLIEIDGEIYKRDDCREVWVNKYDEEISQSEADDREIKGLKAEYSEIIAIL